MLIEGSAKIVFSPHKERIVIERKGTSHDADVNTDTEHGKHTLLRTAEGWEELELRLFYDHGILEIFANERFALSTRLYGGACGVRAISDEKAGEVKARRWDL
jgi:beta-fructofuranosidase